MSNQSNGMTTNSNNSISNINPTNIFDQMINGYIYSNIIKNIDNMQTLNLTNISKLLLLISLNEIKSIFFNCVKCFVKKNKGK